MIGSEKIITSPNPPKPLSPETLNFFDRGAPKAPPATPKVKPGLCRVAAALKTAPLLIGCKLNFSTFGPLVRYSILKVTTFIPSLNPKP